MTEDEMAEWHHGLDGEESKLLHFVNRKTPFCKVPGKEPLEIP